MKTIATLGLLLNLFGVLLLFRYGMPFRIESKGSRGSWELLGTDNEGLAVDNAYRRYGFVGLAAIFAGTVLQIGAMWLH